VKFILAVLAAGALAGCSGDDKGAAPARLDGRANGHRHRGRARRRRPPAPAPDRAGSLADAVARVLPSVVNVRTQTFGGGRGEGSGIVLDRRGIILTNNHVVEGTTGSRSPSTTTCTSTR
jgi:putative serine protease PepD